MAYVDEEERAALDAARAASTSRLLMQCAQLVGQRAIESVRERTGKHDIRPAHTALLWHVELEGIRLTDLAARLDVSKQTASELVDELEAMRVLQRVPDPSDGRAKLIRFARRKGRIALFDVLEVLANVDRRLTAGMTPAEQKALDKGLRALARCLDQAEAGT